MAMTQNASLHKLRLRFVQSLLDGQREITEEEAELRRQSLNLSSVLRIPCVVACISLFYSNVDFSGRDRLVDDCERFVNRFLKKRRHVFYTRVNSCDNIQIILHTVNEEQIDELFIHLHEEIRAAFDLDLFIGIGSCVDTYGRIAVSATEATEMLAYKFQYADRGVVSLKNVVRFQYNMSYGTNDMYKRVIGCFRDGNLEKMRTRLDELITEIRYRPNVSGTSIKRTVIELTVNMLHIASNANVDVDAVLMGEDPYRWIMQQNNTPSIKEWFMRLANQLIEQMSIQKDNSEKHIIQAACDYIGEHLADKGLGLQAVCESVKLSSSYFSQLFKAEKGVGFSKYVVQRRLEAAKQLLKETEFSVKEIAEKVGFSSANYFGIVFKREIGMSPQVYRDINKTIDIS